jgi:hypothetical protein
MYLSSTYQHIQEKSDVVWKNQRYHLICEYVKSPILPPPLNLIIYPYFFVNYLWGFIDKKCKTPEPHESPEIIIVPESGLKSYD